MKSKDGFGDSNIFYITESLQSFMYNENQILVDPMPLNQSTKNEGGRRYTTTATDVFIHLSPQSPPTELGHVTTGLNSSSAPLSSPRSLTKIIQKWRSKSCGERRECPSTGEFNMWPRKIDNRSCTNDDNGEFKCGILCLFLRSFAKGRQVKREKDGEVEEGNIVSRVVSLERFECGSWSSSIEIDDHDDESMDMYFDLPLELMRNTGNDAHSPVTTAFVFESGPKGVLKKSTSRAMETKSKESPRHVRFSLSSTSSHLSSPSPCVMPPTTKGGWGGIQLDASLKAKGA